MRVRSEEGTVLYIEIVTQKNCSHNLCMRARASVLHYLAKDPKLISIMHRAWMLTLQAGQRMEPSILLVTLMLMVEDIDRSRAWTVSDRDVEPARAMWAKEKEGCVLTATAVVTLVLVLFGVLVECIVVWVDGGGDEGQVGGEYLATSIIFC